jgi:hypothetical protein
VDENVCVEIYTSVFKKLFESDYIGLMGHVQERSPENLPGGADLH